MSTRLTYTSGALGSDTDREFEQQLSAARAETHATNRRPRGGCGAGRRASPSIGSDPTTDDAVASRAREAPPRS